MIEVQSLVKHYGTNVAVDGVSFTVRPGAVTGFLGPNGAGKSTTMRVILGLDKPTSGSTSVNGHDIHGMGSPITEIGGLLEARGAEAGRTARNHLRALAATHGIGDDRVKAVLQTVGLTSVADKRVGGFSLGMGQRLGIAAALLGDPQVVMLDEPTIGLDPDGIQWIREFLRGLANEGRTVFVSSHLMSETEMTADHLIVIGRGRILADLPMAEFVARASDGSVSVASPEAQKLSKLVAKGGVDVTRAGRHELEVRGLDATAIGEIAAKAHIALHQLTTRRPSLETAFMDLTQESVTYHGEQVEAFAPTTAPHPQEITS